MKKLSSLIAALAASLCVTAQAPVFITTVPVSVSAGTTFSATGNVTLSGTTSLYNSGSFVLAGNWINNSAVNTVNSSLPGTVIMNGGAQTIGGSFATRFGNLTFSNPVMAIKMMLRPVFIANLRSLNSGVSVLSLNAQLLTLENPATTAFQGNGSILHENSSFAGGVTWFATTSNSYSLPFVNSALNAFAFQFQPVLGDTVTVGTYATTPANLPYPVLPYDVTHVRNASGADNSANMVDRYWKLEVLGSGLQATFGYAVNEFAANGNAGVRAQKWNTTLISWENMLPGQSNPTSQSVNVPNLSATPAGGFVWALSLISSPLPIKLIDFTASATGHKEVTCSWVTETEVNNDYFTLERSQDGFGFEPVATIDGAGHSTIRLFYEWVDNEPFPGMSYYRVKQTDFDGRSSTSQTVSVRLSSDGAMAMTIFPNPASGVFSINLPAGIKTLSLQVAGADGKIVFETANENELDSGIFRSDLSRFAEGIYFVNIQTESGALTSKLVLKK